MKIIKQALVSLFILLSICSMYSQMVVEYSAGFPINYDEDSVGTYTLPDLFTLQNGQKVTDAKTWMNKRRPELLKLIETIQFGKSPLALKPLKYIVFDKGTLVFKNQGLRKQVRIYLTQDTIHKVDVLIYLPENANGPVPMLLNVSFGSNINATNDTTVQAGYIWKNGKRILAQLTAKKNIPNVEKFLEAGIGVATLCYGDIEPDFKEGYEFGIRKHYSTIDRFSPDSWGTIATWSWGLSRIMDYFEADKQINAKRIAVVGASRLGKTVLWTGARDSRFKVVIASVSGEGGAALSRRNYGENLLHITDTTRYFYQFAPNYHSYAARVNQLPFDAHTLVALIAPRPLLLQTGDTDKWSDPKGEFLSAIAAEPVYELFGEKGPQTKIMPQAKDDALLLNDLGYYMHSGGHGIMADDWDKFLLFLKKYL